MLLLDVDHSYFTSHKFNVGMTHIRLFEEAAHADTYLKYRPRYPEELFEKIASFLNEKNPSSQHDLHLDVGCGSGQGTYGMSSQFKRVIGLDISEAQIDEANKTNTKDNVEFKVSPAEILPVEDHSVDLVTAGTAVHWFDLDAFFSECRRILKPNGCLAIYTYTPAQFIHGDKCVEKTLNDDLDWLLHTALGPFLHERYILPKTGYADVDIPLPSFIRDNSIKMNVTWSLTDLMGFIKSFSFCQKYLKTDPSGHLLTEYQSKVLAALGTPGKDSEDISLQVVFPIHLILARNS